MRSPKLLALSGLALLTLLGPWPAAAVDVVVKHPHTKEAGQHPAASAADTLQSSAPESPTGPKELPAALRVRAVSAVPLLLDPNDLGFGASVMFSHLPTVAELNDLAYVPNVTHIVLSLAAWPESSDELQGLAQSPLPQGCDLIVILAGYPPSNAAAAAWNYLKKPLRIVLVVDGPPAGTDVIFLLNGMRGLERVIADMREPSRSGFARLQRPLSFRVVR